MMALPTPHGDKLQALLGNEKLPSSDRKRIEACVARYMDWIGELNGLPKTEDIVLDAVALLQRYRLFVDVDIIFDSQEDFLYRQKGQLKLDNSVIEEFLPHLVTHAFPDLGTNFVLGPDSCFSGLYFTSTLRTAGNGPSAQIRTKDQDFAISKRAFVSTSFSADPGATVQTLAVHLGYLCSECKTNLDKTMFQEASATAHDVKSGVVGAKYLLLCEWLDMTPVSTTGTDIDQVLILRRARRLGSQVRASFATRNGRQANRDAYVQHLVENAFSPDVFKQFLTHVEALLSDHDPIEDDVLQRGFF